jgi:polyphosphate kinase
VFYFQQGALEEIYLSSADWMNRNMVRRVELAWPVTDPLQRQRIKNECLEVYLQDQVDAWDLGADGVYVRATPTLRKKKPGAQASLMALYGRNIKA